MKFLLCLAIIAGLAGCDKEEKKSEDTFIAAPEVQLPDILDFHGYVQTAFLLTIDGVEFNDSEHFYTNFRRDLIVANRPDLAEANIEVLGDYGHTTFGTSAPVFIAPMDDLGHLFESRTDIKRHFKLSVNKDEYLLNSTTQYKSKIMLRIGLVVDGVTSCLLLHSTIENILFEEKRPIIFDTFSTQLNDWECDSEVMENTYEDIKTETVEDIQEEIENPDPAPVVKVLYPIEVGVSTREDILLSFGEPHYRNGDVHWVFNDSEVCLEGFTQCLVTFDADGILETSVNIREELLKKKQPLSQP